MLLAPHASRTKTQGRDLRHGQLPSNKATHQQRYISALPVAALNFVTSSPSLAAHLNQGTTAPHLGLHLQHDIPVLRQQAAFQFHLLIIPGMHTVTYCVSQMLCYEDEICKLCSAQVTCLLKQ